MFKIYAKRSYNPPWVEEVSPTRKMKFLDPTQSNLAPTYKDKEKQDVCLGDIVRTPIPS